MDKKEQIINTAIKLFVKQGFEHTPTSQISKESKVATGTLFHHFKSKEELVNAAYLFAKKSMLDAISKGFNEKDPIKESTRKVWFNLLKWGVNNKPLNDFIQKFYNSAYISTLSRGRAKEGFERIARIFVTGKEQNIFKDLPVELLRDLTMANYYVFVDTYSKVDNTKLQESFDVIWDLLKR